VGQPSFDPSLILILFNEFRWKPCLARVLQEMHCGTCTNSGQAPVNGVHSIENTDVTKRDFSLTQEIEGVQQDRSSTAS
jgi:hypothetical protein